MHSNSSSEAYPMNSGNDPYSYAKNSTIQKETINAVKDFINEGISEKLDLQTLSLPRLIRLADMGCSTGPNTFVAVQNIIEAIHSKYQLQEIDSDQLPEFQVFFNDHASNDFNTLFESLPRNRQYYAAGVPGSFYGPLFPQASLDIVHSSTALHWISQVPEQVVDKTSPAWNEGKIFYSDNETAKAFEDQFAKDMDCFLHFRAKEIIPGGLLIFAIPGRSNETPHSQVAHNIVFHLLGSCLVDMAKKGIISEEQVDTFNMPMYLCSPKELESAIGRNGYFDIERLECMPNNVVGDNLRLLSSHIRAGFETILVYHLGGDIMDELFDSFTKKLENSAALQHGKLFTLFILLKRKFVNWNCPQN